MHRAATTLLAIAAVAAAASSVGAADQAKSHVVRFAVPSAGNFTVAVLEITAPKGSKAKPHPVVMKAGVPKDVDVITGVRRDPKRARSFVEAIVILRHAASKRAVSSVSGAAGGNIDVDPFGTGFGVPFKLRCSQAANALTSPSPRFSHCGPTRNAFVINVCQTNLLFPFVSNVSGFDTGLSIGNTAVAAFDVACHGTRSIRYSNMLKVLGLSQPPPPPTPTLSCTSPFVFFDPTELMSTLRCNENISGFVYLAPPGSSITNHLPGSCIQTPTQLDCSKIAITADTSFPWNIQTNPSPTSAFGGTIQIFQLGAIAQTFTPTGP